MFDRLISFSIHNKLIIGILTLALICWGGYSLYRLPIDAVPDITNNQVVVYTVAPSLAATDIERLVSFPIEQSVATIPGEENVRSFSRFGLSVVTIVFKDGIDIYWARQQVSERLREAESQIPAGTGRPELAPVSTGLGEIYQYLVRAKPGYEKKYDARELRTIQDWIVRRQLLGTPGVADVASFGGLLKQYEVSLDPERLRSLNITVDQVYQAMVRNNQNTGGAYLDKNPATYAIRTEGLVATPEDIRNIVVSSTRTGLPILVRDVANVRLGAAVRYGAMTRNNEGEVTGGIVLMLKGANANEVIKAVKTRMETIRKSLPEGVDVDVYLDRSELVGRAIHTVTKNLIEGALIVIFVLVLFLGNLRAGLVVASVIPLAMLFAIAMMQLFGVSGNLLSLGAIDFGLVVDGAVIIVEAIVHRLHGGSSGLTGRLSRQQMDEETYHAASKIRASASFGEIIILIVYLPLLALVGIEGKMFGPMAQTVAFAIMGAFILSLTYVPMMAALALSRETTHNRTFSDKMMSWFEARYRPLITWALRRKALVLATAVALLAGAFLLFRTLGGEFIPQLAEGDFAVEMRTLTGSSLSYTIEKAQQAGAILKKQFPEVKEVVAKIGAAEIPTDPMPVEAADVMVTLKDPKEWTSAKTQPELAEKMAKALSVIPGVTFGFQQPIQMRFNELISGAKQDVVLKIYGEDLDQLADYAARTARLVRQVPGAEDIYVEQVTGLPQIVVRLNRGRLAQFGLSVDDVNHTVQTAFAGQTAGQVFEQERRFDLVLRLPPALRQDISAVRQLFIATPRGEQVPLEQVADVSLVDGPNQIQRDDAKRRIIVAFNVRGRDVESVVKDVQGRLDRQLKLAPGYHTTYGGQFENLREASQRLSVAVPVALLLIFTLLFFTFRSLLQATMIFTAIPLSAIGGVLALWLRGMPFSISAGVGFIALFGVAVLNGVVLVGYLNQLKEEGVTDLTERILQGTATRLRPVLMTATVASLGFLPMALATSAGAEVQRPLATVVIGGLVTATLLTLLVLPILYALVESRIQKLEKKKAQEEAQEQQEPPQPPAPGAALPQPLLAGALVLLLVWPLAGRAQQAQLSVGGLPFTAQQAVTQAMQANGTVQAAQSALAGQQALRGTATDLGRTTIGLSYGQYNTYRHDNNFSISQTFSLPGVYRRQAQLLDAQVGGQQYQLAQAQAELRRQVRLSYVQAVFARHRIRVLRGQDSLYSEFLRYASLRFKTGEVARLEPATALVRQGETQALIRQARTGYQVAQRQLQALLQQATVVAIADSVLTPLEPVVLPAPGDTTRLLQNPNAQVLRQLIAQRQAAVRVEQAQGLPNVTLGYFNQSLRGPQTIGGIGGPERDYSGSDRFQGVQGSVGIPILRGPQKSRVQAARIQEQVATISYRRQLVELAGRQDELVAQHAEQQQRLAFYQQTALPQAAIIVRLSTLAFRAGETGYSEYLLNLERALSLRTAYLDVLLEHNQTVIELDYLLNSTPQ